MPKLQRKKQITLEKESLTVDKHGSVQTLMNQFHLLQISRTHYIHPAESTPHPTK